MSEDGRWLIYLLAGGYGAMGLAIASLFAWARGLVREYQAELRGVHEARAQEAKAMTERYEAAYLAVADAIHGMREAVDDLSAKGGKRR